MSSEIIMYQTDDGLTKIETTCDGDTVWLSVDQMAKLFQRGKSVIGKHIRNIFKEGELVSNKEPSPCFINGCLSFFDRRVERSPVRGGNGGYVPHVQ